MRDSRQVLPHGLNVLTPAERFLELWGGAQPPDLDTYISQLRDALPTDVCAVLRVDLRERWRRGESAWAESYLARYATIAADPELALDLIFSEFLLREDLGHAPEQAAYTKRFPQYAEALSTQFSVHLGVFAAQNAWRDEGSVANESTGDASFSLGFDDHQDIAAGAQMGRYRVIRLLGRGGMGSVYLALDTMLGREVALKLPRSRKYSGEELINRLYREGRAAAKLTHPNLCAIHDIGTEGDVPYLAMQYISGETLAGRLRRDGPLRLERALDIAQKIAAALEVVHRAGIVHRDLKPANVMFNEDNEPIVMDFGLAFFDSPDGGGDSKNSRDLMGMADTPDDGSRLTELGRIVGTPAYAAPEQILGAPAVITFACDVYGLGAVLYEMLTARPPFEGSLADITHQVLTSLPRRPAELIVGLPKIVDEICLRAMAKQPASRFESIASLRQAFAEAATQLAVVNHRQATDPVANPASAQSRLLVTRRRVVLAGVAVAASATAAFKALDLGSKRESLEGEAGLPPVSPPNTQQPISMALQLDSDGPPLKLVRKQEWHNRHAFLTQFSPKGDFYGASGEYFRNDPVRLWSTQSGDEVLQVAGALLRFSPDGKTLHVPVGHKEVEIQRWELGTDKSLPAIPVPCPSPVDLNVLPDGRHLVISNPNEVMIWDCVASARRATISLSGIDAPYLCPLEQYSSTIVFDRMGHDMSIRVLDWKSGKVTASFLSPAASQDRMVKVSPDNQHMVVLDAHSIAFWLLDPPRRIRTLTTESSIALAAKAVSPDLNWALLTHKKSPHIYLVNLTTGLTHSVFSDAAQAAIADHGFSPDQRLAVICTPWPSDVYLFETPPEVWRDPKTAG